MFEIIQKKYPDASKENIQKGLSQIIGIADIPDASIITTIQNAQTYFAQFKHTEFWDTVRSVTAQVLTFAMSPKQTAAGLIANLIEWVFRKKVQK